VTRPLPAPTAPTARSADSADSAPIPPRAGIPTRFFHEASCARRGDDPKPGKRWRRSNELENRYVLLCLDPLNPRILPGAHFHAMG
jgi:hypothetical protein